MAKAKSTSKRKIFFLVLAFGVIVLFIYSLTVPIATDRNSYIKPLSKQTDDDKQGLCNGVHLSDPDYVYPPGTDFHLFRGQLGEFRRAIKAVKDWGDESEINQPSCLTTEYRLFLW